jgi:1-acyl-sn-glycerol-3-phosphate acyltransferase
MIAGLIRLLTGIHCRWQDPLVAERQCLFFANHRSHLDAITIWASLPPILRARCRPVAAQDYWSTGPLRRFLAGRVFRAVLIPRSGITHHNNPLPTMRAAIDAGDSLILFPEGGRAAADCTEVVRFKSGLAHLAKAYPDLALVPVWLDNLNRILPKGEFLPVPFIGRASFGAALRMEPGEDREDFLERARRALAALSPAHHEGATHES